MKKNPTLLTAILIASTLLLSVFSSAQSVTSMESAIQSATLITDKEDYAPGETVLIIGSGFLPQEFVTLQVLHADALGDNETSDAHAPWHTMADERGNISSTWRVPIDEDEWGALLKITADGEGSSLHAETTF